jgi:hypothetical protein
MSSLYLVSVFIAAGLSGAFCTAVGYRMVANYTGSDPLANDPPTSVAFVYIMFAFVWGMVASLVASFLPPLLGLVTAILLAPCVVAALAGLVAVCIYTGRFLRTVQIPNIVTAIADRICPPREPGRFEDEHDPV